MRKKKQIARAGATKNGDITNALVDAAVEVGHAAEHIKSSLEHMQKAGEKGKHVAAPVLRAGNRAVRAVQKRLSRTKQ